MNFRTATRSHILKCQDFINKHSRILNASNTLLLHSETKDSLSVFARMSELGFATSNSQEGRIEYEEKKVAMDSAIMATALDSMTEDSKDWSATLDEKYTSLGGSYQDITDGKIISSTERAYVSGFMSLKLARIFIHYFNRSDKIAFLPNQSIPVTYCQSNSIDKALYSILPPGTLPNCTRIPLTNSSSIIGDRLHDQWDEAFIVQTSDLEMQKEFVEVSCIDPTHGRLARDPKQGLYQEIISSLEMCHKAIL